MQEIDLGSELEIKVKYAGAEYALREPTVAEVEQFSKEDIASGGIETLVVFLERLGMPREVIMGMGMSKAKQLVDGLMELLTKKK